MALFEIKLELPENQAKLIRKLVKYVIIIFLIHVLMSVSGNNDWNIGGELFNGGFVGFLISLILAMAIYYLVIVELVKIK